VLVVAPWTIWWRRNFFAELVPWIQPVMASPVMRAAVVALGVVTVLAGLSEFRQLFIQRAWRRARTGEPPRS
jgi:hypothetical protein